ncbi:hypothetical protein [Herbihabitans rhizosphaerae]|nr:hypothetical protein [Herbihabitans rhizosphaerae]
MRLSTRMESSWRGDAGGAARRGGLPMAAEHQLSAPELFAAHDLVRRQADSFNEAKRSVVPVPPQPEGPAPWGGVGDPNVATFEQQTSAHNAAAQRNVDSMTVYEDHSIYNTDNLPGTYGALAGDGAGFGVAAQPGGRPDGPGIREPGTPPPIVGGDPPRGSGETVSPPPGSGDRSGPAPIPGPGPTPGPTPTPTPGPGSGSDWRGGTTPEEYVPAPPPEQGQQRLPSGPVAGGPPQGGPGPSGGVGFVPGGGSTGSSPGYGRGGGAPGTGGVGSRPGEPHGPGGRAGGVAGPGEAHGPASRGGAGGAGARGGAGMGGMPMGGGHGRGDDDKEHQTPAFLKREDEDLWEGDTPVVAPPVIGVDD